MAQMQRGQDETPGTANSGTGGGVLGQHEEHKPGMAEKFKSTFSSLTGMMGGGGSPKATVDETEQPSKASGPGGNAAVPDSVENKENSPTAPGLSHTLTHHAVGEGTRGRVGDVVTPPPTSATADQISSRDGEAVSPQIPRKDLGERIIDKLPGSHTNPYSTGHQVPQQGTNQYNSGDGAAAHSTDHVTREGTQPYVSGDPAIAPTRPGAQSNPDSTDHLSNKQDGTNPYVSGGDGVAPTSPAANQSTSRPSGFAGNLKNMVTGQKAAQGTGTANATAGTAGTTGASGASDGYVQGPTPRERGDLYDRTKEYFARGDKKGPDVGSEETWPSPAHSDIKNTPGATYTNAEGRPIEGPTQPHSEDTKKEGLMSKLKDKLHLHEKSSSPKASSPRATTANSNATYTA